MEYFRLKVFETVCRHGSFTLAAKELGISQPAVSQNVSELEKETGIRLFVRRGSSWGVKPSAGAQVFLPFAREIIRQIDGAGVLFRPLPADCHSVRLGCSVSYSQYVLPYVLKSLKSLYPHLEVKVVSSNETADVTVADVPEMLRGSLSLRFNVLGTHPVVPLVTILTERFLSGNADLPAESL